jgi:hypothetical protein
MVLPPEYAWIGLVLIVAVAVFVADLIGNMISFKNRVMNALTTAGVSAVAFGLLVYFLYGTVMLTSWGFAVMQALPDTGRTGQASAPGATGWPLAQLVPQPLYGNVQNSSASPTHFKWINGPTGCDRYRLIFFRRESTIPRGAACNEG